jgi:hypothetical protein
MARGSRGPGDYPDWQRVINARSPTLAFRTLGTMEGPITTGVLRVTTYDNVSVFFEVGVDATESKFIQITFEWAEDAAFTMRSGEVKYVLLERATFSTQAVTLPNMGTYVKITATVIVKGPKGVIGWTVSATTTTPATPSPVVEPGFINGNVLVPAESFHYFHPPYLYAGPMQAVLRTTVERQMFFHVEAWSFPLGALTQVWTHEIEMANLSEEISFQAPLGYWRPSLNSASAGEHVVLVEILPAVTGA